MKSLCPTLPPYYLVTLDFQIPMISPILFMESYNLIMAMWKKRPWTLGMGIHFSLKIGHPRACERESYSSMCSQLSLFLTDPSRKLLVCLMYGMSVYCLLWACLIGTIPGLVLWFSSMQKVTIIGGFFKILTWGHLKDELNKKKKNISWIGTHAAGFFY